MFEKEAEEYGLHQALWCSSESCDLQAAFKNGAEFGYNKGAEKAKSLIEKLLACFSCYAVNIFENELVKESEQFLGGD